MSAIFRTVLACLLLAGCASPQARDFIVDPAIEAPGDAIAGSHHILVATTRAPADSKSQLFGGSRSAIVNFASVDVSVPKIHRVGSIERRKRGQPDPAKYFTATNVVGHPDTRAFEAALRRQVAERGGRAMVFIHGYNTGFDDAVYRIAQIAHDSGYTGAPVLFSWASGGSTVDYVYDSNSASAARDALEGTLRLAVKAGAKRVDVIAHSMGTWVTMEALRQLAITGDRDLGGRLGDVVLASPDIDVDVFKTQMRRYGKPDKPFFVLLSGDDRALLISSIIAGNRPRLGDYRDARDIAELGVIVADLSGVEAGGSLNHTKFAENPLLVKLLGDRLSDTTEGPLGEREVTDRINSLAQGLGQTIGSAAEIIITTPIDVVRVAVGQ